jgi:replication factor C small subunit
MTVRGLGKHMSDAEGQEKSAGGRQDVWTEKYRPQTLDEIVGQEGITERLQSYIQRDDLPNLLFAGEAGIGKTTAATAIAREIYGDSWEQNFLELNASDERGIDVVRGRIKDFARSSFGGEVQGYSYRIIFLDEADALTSDAQSALRRTMEQFSNSTRFILSCNYSSQIIDPIQSRCAVFRFAPLGDDAVEEQVRKIAAEEGIDLTQDGVDALAYAADGDMRKAINALQAAAVMGETVDEDTVYTITSTARPEEVEKMVQTAIDGDFVAARSQLRDLLVDKGIAGGDVIDQLHRSVWDLDIDDDAAVHLMDRVGEADYRITEGANERVQLEAMLASLALKAGDR